MNSKTPLEEFCKIVQGGRLKLSGNDFVDSGYPAYGAGGLNGYLPTAEFGQEAVILSAIGARCGKCFYVKGEWTSLANTQLIFPDSMKADAKFLWYQLNDEKRWPRNGAGQPFIKPSDVKRHLVHLPPLDEQRRIAAILDQADSLRRKRRELISKLTKIPKVLFANLVENSNFPLELVPFSEAVFFQEGPGVRNWQFRDEGVKLVNVKNIVDGLLDTSNSSRYLSAAEVQERYQHFLLDAGDYVLASSGVTWGKIAEVRNADLPLCLNTSMIRIRSNSPDFENEFIRAFIEFGNFRRQIERLITGSAQPNFGPSHLKQVMIPKLGILMQREFVEKAKMVKGQKAVYERQEGVFERLFLTLVHRFFGSQPADANQALAAE